MYVASWVASVCTSLSTVYVQTELLARPKFGLLLKIISSVIPKTSLPKHHSLCRASFPGHTWERGSSCGLGTRLELWPGNEVRVKCEAIRILDSPMVEEYRAEKALVQSLMRKEDFPT